MAIDTKKLLPHASKANVVSDKSVENISTIASTLIDVDTIMKGSLLLEEMRRKKKAKEDEKKKRSLKERMREGVKSVGKGVVDKAKKVGGSMMDWLNRLVFGMILIGLFKLKDVIMPILPVLAKIVDVVINVAGWIFNAVSTLVHWGYMFVDMIRGFVKNIFGEGGLKVFDNLLGALNTFFNAALMGVMALLKFKWLRNFAKGITKRIGKLIMKIPGVKQAVRKAGVLGKRLIGRGGRKILKSIGQKGLKKTITGGLKAAASKGAAKVGGFAVKIFGKAAKVIGPAFKSAKPFLSKFFGKVPIVGPLIICLLYTSPSPRDS